MKLSFHRFTIHPKVPFAIARSSTTVYERVLVRLRDDALVEGWGEAAPNAYYKVRPDATLRAEVEGLLGPGALVLARTNGAGTAARD